MIAIKVASTNATRVAETLAKTPVVAITITLN